MSLQGDSLFERGICWDLGRTNGPTSARHGDGFGFIRIWATPPNRLVFWDGVLSPYIRIFRLGSGFLSGSDTILSIIRYWKRKR